jgi:hypothetical protein
LATVPGKKYDEGKIEKEQIVRYKEVEYMKEGRLIVRNTGMVGKAHMQIHSVQLRTYGTK